MGSVQAGPVVWERVEYQDTPRLPQYRHPHDCTNCEAIGKIIKTRMFRVDGDLVAEQEWVDCYACIRPPWSGTSSVVARFGEDGDYHSASLVNRREPIQGDPMLEWCVHLLALRGCSAPELSG